MIPLSKCCGAKLEKYHNFHGIKSCLVKDAKVVLVCKSCGKESEEGATEPPMGVSQWMEHGKRYGYSKYFESNTIKFFLQKLEADGIGFTYGQQIIIDDNLNSG